MYFKNSEAGIVVRNLAETIRSNREYLSEIDGETGDGDHGINMDKGFSLAMVKCAQTDLSLSEGLGILADTLLNDIGGSMGPLYGMFFQAIGETAADHEDIDKEIFLKMLENGVGEICEIGSARRGDKSLLDTLVPALEAYRAALLKGDQFGSALDSLKSAAKEGWLSTKDMVAQIGRASRLGERSRGHLDAGATSAYLLLSTFADSIQKLLMTNK